MALKQRPDAGNRPWPARPGQLGSVMVGPVYMANMLPAEVLINRMAVRGQNFFLNSLDLAWGQSAGGRGSCANDFAPSSEVSHRTRSILTVPQARPAGPAILVDSNTPLDTGLPGIQLGF